MCLRVCACVFTPLWRGGQQRPTTSLSPEGEKRDLPRALRGRGRRRPATARREPPRASRTRGAANPHVLLASAAVPLGPRPF
eukprot:2765434-Alexandrium_andersonii.AAC.1